MLRRSPTSGPSRWALGTRRSWSLTENSPITIDDYSARRPHQNGRFAHVGPKIEVFAP